LGALPIKQKLNPNILTLTIKPNPDPYANDNPNQSLAVLGIQFLQKYPKHE